MAWRHLLVRLLLAGTVYWRGANMLTGVEENSYTRAPTHQAAVFCSVVKFKIHNDK